MTPEEKTTYLAGLRRRDNEQAAVQRKLRFDMLRLKGWMKEVKRRRASHAAPDDAVEKVKAYLAAHVSTRDEFRSRDVRPEGVDKRRVSEALWHLSETPGGGVISVGYGRWAHCIGRAVA